jgi:hypothetical protein
MPKNQELCRQKALTVASGAQMGKIECNWFIMRKGGGMRRLLVTLLSDTTYVIGIFGLSCALGSFAGWLVGN